MKFSNDLWFNAFLLHKGIKMSSYDVIGPGKVRCYWNLTEDEWKEYKLEFNNSDFIKFKALTDQIRDLAF